MRKSVIVVAMFCSSAASAQMPGIGESVAPLLPGITVRVVREAPREVNNGGDFCGGNYPTIWECPGSPPFPTSWGVNGNFTIGFDAAGNAYHVANNPFAYPDGSANLLRRVSPSSVMEDVAVVYRTRTISGWYMRFDPQGAIIDVTSGRIWLLVMGWYNDPGGWRPATVGTVEISGAPTLFDTLLTFVPGGQLAALMPAHPDGFRGADAVQVWTGDVRSMPDWSQAQPLTCSAATNPTPGQVVSVPDTLPAPALGHARYYLTATVNGPDRRLGRQYGNAAYSAREPDSLPACQ